MSKQPFFFHQVVRLNYPSNQTITVEEKRAPTDESVRLLNEMREAVIKSILGSLHCSDNAVNFSMVVINDDYAAQTNIRYKLTINGEDIVGNLKSDFMGVSEDVEANPLIRAVYEDLSGRIARFLLSKEMPKIIRRDGSIWR